MSREKNGQKGFTLIEIMAVVIIIGLLATLVGPRIWSMLHHGQTEIAATKCRDYYNTVKTYMAISKTKQVPTDLSELEKPAAPGEEPMIAKVDDDPWGNKYVIEPIEGRKFRIRCFGPDGLDGTDDDIMYPEPQK